MKRSVRRRSCCWGPNTEKSHPACGANDDSGDTTTWVPPTRRTIRRNRSPALKPYGGNPLAGKRYLHEDPKQLSGYVVPGAVVTSSAVPRTPPTVRDAIDSTPRSGLDCSQTTRSGGTGTSLSVAVGS